MKKVGILSLGKYVPENKLTNSDLEKMVETSDDWIQTRSGIQERRIALKEEKTSDLGAKAAMEALNKSGLKAEQIDLIIVATATPDSNFPSVACLVQKAIGAKNAAAFDVSAACSGYLYAMTTAKQFIKTGFYKHVLVVAAEKFSSIVNWQDRSTCVLFGDGAGACVLGEVQEGGLISSFLESKGEHAGMMSVVVEDVRHPSDQDREHGKLPYVVMNGTEIFKIAVNSMAQAVKHVLKDANLTADDIKCVVPHQANDRIISAVAKKLSIPKDEFYINIHRYGNMSAAALAVALYEAVEEGRIHKGDYVVLVAFGAGLVSAANVIKW